MAFSSRRGRPRKPSAMSSDPGTAELRFKHAQGLTMEPIDLCLHKQLITQEQHWCGLHLRWLYTLRYGAPSLTVKYTSQPSTSAVNDDPTWRSLREREYTDAVRLLQEQRFFEPVMRLSVFNELPAFLNASLRARAWKEAAMATQLARTHRQVTDGLSVLVEYWQRNPDRRAPS